MRESSQENRRTWINGLPSRAQRTGSLRFSVVRSAESLNEAAGQSRKRPGLGERWQKLLTLVVALLMTAPVASAQAQEATWKVGFASIEITPEFPVGMAGYGGRLEEASESLTSLHAKAMMLDDGRSGRAILVTLDLVGIERSHALRLRRSIAQRHELQLEHVILACSHTHTGPIVGRNLAAMHYWLLNEVQQQQVDRYAQWLDQRIDQVVDQAVANLEVGSLSWGMGSCDVAVNRRNNSEPLVPALRAQNKLKGPEDHRVPVLAAYNAQGELKGIVFGYACHATVLSSVQWSGDYPAFAQATLESKFPGAVAMFWAGCGADQNPLPRRSPELAQHYGERLAGSVESVLRTHTLKSLAPRLRASREEVPLKLSAETSVEYWREQLQASDRFAQGRARAILETQDEHGDIPTTYPYSVAAWILGENSSIVSPSGSDKSIAWVFLSGEVVVDYSLALRQWETNPPAPNRPDAQPASIWVTAYANDVMAYIPSRRVLSEGGYEGGDSMLYYGLPGIWTEAIEQEILAAVRRQLESCLTR